MDEIKELLNQTKQLKDLSLKETTLIEFVEAELELQQTDYENYRTILKSLLNNH